MADKKSKEKTDPGTPKAKAKETKAPKAKAPAKKAEGLKLGKEPDHKTKTTIRCRTQGGWKLYIPAIEFWVPGEAEELEVTAAQLERLTADGRVMIGGQIDAFEAELAGIKDRKVKGTLVKPPSRTEISDELPANYPGGPRLPNVEVPKDAKSAKDLVAEERKELKARRADRARRAKRVS